MDIPLSTISHPSLKEIKFWKISYVVWYVWLTTVIFKPVSDPSISESFLIYGNKIELRENGVYTVQSIFDNIQFKIKWFGGTIVLRTCHTSNGELHEVPSKEPWRNIFWLSKILRKWTPNTCSVRTWQCFHLVYYYSEVLGVFLA